MNTAAALLFGCLSLHLCTLLVHGNDCSQNIDCNGGDCVSQAVSGLRTPVFRCECKDERSGTFCENSPCKTKFGKDCQNGAKCIELEGDGGGHYCDCKALLPGGGQWQGKTCDVPSRLACNQVTCGFNKANLGGTCTAQSDRDFTCNCNQGYSGAYCHIKDSSIAVSPVDTTVVKGRQSTFTCGNTASGTKTFILQKKSGGVWSNVAGNSDDIAAVSWAKVETFNTLGSFEYRCRIEMSGGSNFESKVITIKVIDQTKTGQCQSITCAHGGNCVEAHGRAWCQCVGAWEGNYCDRAITQASDPCQHVDCGSGNTCVFDSTANGGFRCNCIADWFGRYCEKARPKPNDACSKSSECEGLKCTGSEVGYCKFGEFKCKCKPSFGVIACSSHIVCATNCPANPQNQNKRFGLCLSNMKCICFQDEFQYIQYQQNNNWPTGSIFKQ